MANEAQYYSPIIQAMIATANRNQQANEFQQTHELAQQQSKRADLEAKVQQQRADQEEKRIEYEHENLQNTLANTTKLLSAHLGEMRNNALQAARNNIASGVSPTAYQRQGFTVPVNGGIPIPATPSDQMDIPGYGRVPVSSMPTQQQQADFAAKQAGNVTSAQLGAAEPFKVMEDTRKRQDDQLKRDDDFTKGMAIAAQNGKNQLDVAKIHAAAASSDALINQATHLKGIAMMHQFGLDDGSGTQATYSKNLADDIYNGSANYKDYTPDQKKAVDSYIAATGQTGLPTDGKAYKKGLDSIATLQQNLQAARELAQNYSRDAPKGGLLARVNPYSEANSKLDTFKANMGQLATTLEQTGRKTDALIVRQQQAIFDPTKTMAENNQKIDDTTKALEPVVKNNFVGMDPNRINVVLKNRGITEFGGYNSPAAPPAAPGQVPATPPGATPQSPPQAAPKPIAANPGVLSPNDYLKSIGHPGIPQQ